jgi:hypothetical protein
MKERRCGFIFLNRHFTIASFLVAGCLAASAGAAKAAEEKPPIDPRADELLKRMGDYLGQARFFSVNAEIWQDVQLASGQRAQAGRDLTLQVRRPDKLRAEVHSTRRNRELVYDGRNVTLFNRAQNFYGGFPASGPLDETMDIASERFGIPMPLEDFVRSDPHKDLTQKVTSGVDIGATTVMGVHCEHLAFSQNNIDWQVWIEEGPRPVPRKFVITYKDEPECPQFTAIFSKWDFTTALPDFVFKFEPPPGANKIDVKEIKAATAAHASVQKEDK